MNWNFFSLVLASATGWGVLALGYLPISVLRQHSKQPLVFVGAWAVVAATAPSVVFHWYLIFALIGLIAWTKLDRPAGKVCLAIAAALGLSLGIVFPLEAPLVSGSITLIGGPGSTLIENPLALASLYLGGAVTGIGYVLCVVAVRHSKIEWRLDPYGRWLLIFAMAWTTLFAVRLPWHLLIRAWDLTWVWAPALLGVVLIVVAFFALIALRRQVFRAAAFFAGLAALAAFGTSLVVQLLLR